ncbi:hypothetical protein LMG27174_00839 [Paraburkholderia rhynchosiae]|uniref:Uncharacterized protein n=2 Tax=Paraburkholderia rhynchosiae TaxID=487049 RepID=A0A2N7WTW7_9BURK|nr:hypothetical protein C0Z16_04695 [Paraburkholderia rhynchosiae]CAB3645730.1 hypothetical protein LMG27174_00839 [Paraburkholderia rhynchosiae]
MAGGRIKISEERWAYARREFESGNLPSLGKVAAMLGCAKNAVAERVRREGWKRPGEVVGEAAEVFGQAAAAFEKNARAGQASASGKNSDRVQQKPLPVTEVKLIAMDGGASGGDGRNAPPPDANGGSSADDNAPKHPMSAPFPTVNHRMTVAEQRRRIDWHTAERGRALTQWHALELAKLNMAVQTGLDLAAAGNPDGLIQVKTCQLAAKLLIDKQALERAQLDAQHKDALASMNYDPAHEAEMTARPEKKWDGPSTVSLGIQGTKEAQDVESKPAPVSAEILKLVRHTVRRANGATEVYESPIE